jgi:hypothetical protein
VSVERDGEEATECGIEGGRTRNPGKVGELLLWAPDHSTTYDGVPGGGSIMIIIQIVV